jgi:hypothetical protein
MQQRHQLNSKCRLRIETCRCLVQCLTGAWL